MKERFPLNPIWYFMWLFINYFRYRSTLRRFGIDNYRRYLKWVFI